MSKEALAIATAERSDESLLRFYREGDETAAASLYRRYAPRLRVLAAKHCTPKFDGRFDADDVLQSVFATFFRGVRDRNYTVPSNGEIWALLTVLAINKIRGLVEHHQAGKRAIAATETSSLLEHILSNDDSAAGLMRVALDDFLVGVPDANQAMIHLRVLGYTVREIANRTGRSQRTVERVLQDFRKRMRDR